MNEREARASRSLFCADFRLFLHSQSFPLRIGFFASPSSGRLPQHMEDGRGVRAGSRATFLAARGPRAASSVGEESFQIGPPSGQFSRKHTCTHKNRRRAAPSVGLVDVGPCSRPPPCPSSALPPRTRSSPLPRNHLFAGRSRLSKRCSARSTQETSTKPGA